ncbi:hypothetical protein [Catellatospora chokoriensis]|uniref:Uncharacterized protein n=1 Tax=Catellatospora chokoriensis TaxID=310353 RepID=A0A8J3K7I3_9ACTN|nr:hypothetical protein [Catellatospora chokoriensis]GIF94028.1 hypothetical protein Cch02nite_74720 [Catellatospora chokoriensis]
MHALPAAPIRARLHPHDVTTLMAQMHDATGPQDLLNIVLAGVYAPLLAAQGRSLSNLSPSDRIRPQMWLLPAPQVDVIIEAACNRAMAWGAAAGICLDLVDKLPSGFPDNEPVPAALPLDYRPAHLQMTVDRKAADVFLAADAHLKALAACYGAGHRFHIDAQSSWVEAFSALMCLHLGPQTTVQPLGELGLRVAAAGGGVAYYVEFQPLPRACVAGDDCQAVFGDDGYIANPWQLIAGHTHVPAFPRTAVKPGVWRTRPALSWALPA